jgi:methylmalonyl-CoA mutase
MDAREELFREFETVSTEDWLQKIRQDLKDCSFEKLVWKNREGIEIRPFYRQEDTDNLAYLKDAPIRKRLTSIDGTSWEIRQDITVYDLLSPITSRSVLKDCSLC